MTCPLEKTYCGLPSMGWYGSDTEYLIGAGTMAEAVHCLLGSIGSVHARSDFTIEQEHISEELGIVRWVLDEYSRSIYNGSTFTGSKPQYQLGTIESIKKNSPRLFERAEKLIEEMDDCEVENQIQESCVEIAFAGFEVIQKLAVAMMRSAIEFERTGKLPNAFRDNELKSKVSLLTSAVKAGLSHQGFKLFPYERFVGDKVKVYRNPVEGPSEKKKRKKRRR